MELKPYINYNDDEYQNEVYSNLSNINIYIPKIGITIPKESDYNKGYYYRYFFRLLNNKDAKVYETTEKEYNNLQSNVLYKTLKIKWKLIGPRDIAKEINTKIIDTSNQILPGIKSILIDPLQFWKNLPEIVAQFDVTNKLPRAKIKKKRYNLNLIEVVGFDYRGQIYLLTENYDIIFTEDFVGILFQA